MFEKYERPEMEIARFDVEDIITTSGGPTLDEDELPIVPGK